MYTYVKCAYLRIIRGHSVTSLQNIHVKQKWRRKVCCIRESITSQYIHVLFAYLRKIYAPNCRGQCFLAQVLIVFLETPASFANQEMFADLKQRRIDQLTFAKLSDSVRISIFAFRGKVGSLLRFVLYMTTHLTPFCYNCELY